MSKIIVIIAVTLSIFLVDKFYFQEYRFENEFEVPEGFLQKGTLGRLLRKNNLIQVSSDSTPAAINDLCAEDEDIKNYNYHNTYRFRFKIYSEASTRLGVHVTFPEARRYRELIEIVHVDPGRQFYTVSFVAHKGLDFQIELTNKSARPFVIRDILVDGRYGRTVTLMEEGKPLIGTVDSVHPVFSHPEKNIQGIELPVLDSKETLIVNEGLPDELFSGVFPGKKNQGFCGYVAYSSNSDLPELQQTIIPTVNLTVDPKYLYGETGIVDNKEGKGRAWEVLASIDVRDGEISDHQLVGLRFHGGTPGRKKNIESFRVNARKAYGKTELDMKPIFGQERALGAKGIVFKYTYQAYDLKKTIYNPYNHVLALEIAKELGALVPAHQLVDLNINEKSYGMYLAMEHLSRRTVKHWLGHDDFKMMTYKKYNTNEQQYSVMRSIADVLDAKGDETLSILEKIYDLDNVLNLVMLSAYISDDDYCQGIDISQEIEDSELRQITSVNWDLDHAFLLFENGQYSMPSKREGIGEAFDILKQNKPHGASLCHRKWVFSHVYTQSTKFRKLVRDKLESVLDNELSVENINAMIARYRMIDQDYYQGRNEAVLKELERYAKERPIVLRQEINELEEWVKEGVHPVFLENN